MDNEVTYTRMGHVKIFAHTCLLRFDSLRFHELGCTMKRFIRFFLESHAVDAHQDRCL